MGSGSKKTVFLVAVFFGVWLSLRFLFPLLSPFLLGLALALAAEPMVAFLTRRLRMPRAVSAGIGVSMAFCFLAMGVMLLLALLVREARSLTGMLPEAEAAVKSGIHRLHSWTLTLTGHAPAGLRPVLRENIDAFFTDGTALVDRSAGYLLSRAGSALSHVPDRALTLGTGLISAFLISARLPRLRRFLLRQIPRQRLKALAAAAKRVRAALGGWLLAQGKLMGLTLLLLLAGFSLLRIPGAVFWALGVTAVDAFPILGTGTILLPWALLSFLQQNTPRAVGLLGLYATVTLTRSLLEPRLVGRHLGLDPLATLMSLYIGYRLWGLGGMLLSPLLAVTALQLVPERK